MYNLAPIILLYCLISCQLACAAMEINCRVSKFTCHVPYMQSFWAGILLFAVNQRCLDALQYMSKIDQIILQSVGLGNDSEDLTDANVLVPKADFQRG